MVQDAFLIGERIYLRALQDSDAEGNYVQWFNDSEVCRYNSHHLYPYTRDQALSYIKEVNKFSNTLVLAIVLKENDVHIGNIALQNICSINRSAEFAIILGEKKYWGQGYSKEASLLIIRHGFFELNLNRIYCGTSIDNIPMQKLANFLGMFKEGVRKQALFANGTFVDLIEYGLLKKIKNKGR